MDKREMVGMKGIGQGVPALRRLALWLDLSTILDGEGIRKWDSRVEESCPLSLASAQWSFVASDWEFF
jgi:hypothetical protein